MSEGLGRQSKHTKKNTWWLLGRIYFAFGLSRAVPCLIILFFCKEDDRNFEEHRESRPEKSIPGARTLLGAPGLTTRSKNATSSKCIASSNKCLTSSNKKLLVTRSY